MKTCLEFPLCTCNSQGEMMKRLLSLPRRQFIGNLVGTAALAGGVSPVLFEKPGRFAEELTKTPSMTEGPFYPDRLPLDTDNDLLVLNDSINPAVGEITHFGGKILDQNGNALRNARVEIWQCDAKIEHIDFTDS